MKDLFYGWINEFYGWFTASPIISGIIVALILIYLYKCFVKVREDTAKVVESFTGNFVRGISGIKEKKFDKDGNLVEGSKASFLGIKGLAFIFFLFQRIPKYEVRKIVHVNPKNISEENYKFIVRGDPQKGTLVSIFEESISNHYRKEFSYEMKFDDIETGHEKNTNQTPGDTKKPQTQNVKFMITLNITVELTNIKDAHYRQGNPGKWLEVLYVVTTAALNKLFSDKSFNGIDELRGKKIADQIMPSDTKTFKEWINDDMLEVKQLGYGVKDIDFCDFDIDPASKAFTEALSDLAVSELRKGEAENKAEAKRVQLKPLIEAQKDLLKAKLDAEIKKMGIVDKTAEMIMSKLPPGLRVLDIGTLYSGTNQKSTTNEIVNTALAVELADEFKDEKDQKGGESNSKKEKDKK